MNKITILIFSCEKYSNLWKNNLLFIKRNFEKVFVEEIFVITDKHHFEAVEGANVIVANDNNNFIKRFKIGIEACKTESFILLLDDYYVTNIDNIKFGNLLTYFGGNKIGYCKLYCRNKKYLVRNKPYHLLDTSIKYAVDLYPGIWRKSFAEKLVNNWQSDNTTIWGFEANLWKQELIKESRTLICAIDGELTFLDVIRKGKMLRHSYRYLKKRNMLIEGIKRRTIVESFIDHISVFLSHHISEKRKNIIKKRFHKNDY